MTPGLPFSKMQAVGNDFVVIEEAVWGATNDWAQAAIRLCNRHNGIGSDGLLVVCPSEVADLRMRMFNPDGTEDMCGNGLRCVVRWAFEHGSFVDGTDKPSGSVETLDGVRNVGLIVYEDSIVEEIWTEMAEPRFSPTDLPSNISGYDTLIDFPLVVEQVKVVVSTINTGSTHTVIWSDALPNDETFLSLSPKIEHHSLFPERTSVIWAKPAHDNTLEVRIWERGVGETLGCGTGAVAVAVLAALGGKSARTVSLSERNTRPKRRSPPVKQSFNIRVTSRGGELNVLYDIDTRNKPYEQGSSPLLIGMACIVYSGVVSHTV